MMGTDSGPSSADARFRRWQDRTQQQLGFLNNALAGLAAGLVAILAGYALDVDRVSKLGPWSRWTFGAALIVLALDVVVGLSLAVNRLRSIRVTAAHIRLQYLKGVIENNDLSGDEARRRNRQVRNRLKFLESLWPLPSPGAKRALREAVRSAKEALADEGATARSDDGGHELGRAIQAARDWSDSADRWTYRLLWSQFVLFGAGAVLLGAASLRSVW
jgi:hypothetical protein